MPGYVLTINGGSSSVKFALFRCAGDFMRRELAGAIDRIGQPNSSVTVRDGSGKKIDSLQRNISNPKEAADGLARGIKEHMGSESPAAIGHRIVHGGPKHLEHALIAPEMLAELKRVSPIDPDHLPGEIALIEALSKSFPGVPEVACFDTAFHRDLPAVAKTLPIPREYAAEGIHRYGFHGLSYSYLMEELGRQAGAEAASGRVVLAHLGAGASMAAVREGRCIDTTMSFTPTAGLVMATRCGDLDPGVLVYLMREHKMTADQIDELINRQSGLLGVSGTTSDMRDLLAKRATDKQAALAVDIFCYQARKWIGALAAALGGLDTLVFSGGIGEHATEVRAQICSGLEHLGVRLNADRNAASAAVISDDNSSATVRVIPTDEEIMIAQATNRIVNLQP